jgi:hypothetical protein
MPVTARHGHGNPLATAMIAPERTWAVPFHMSRVDEVMWESSPAAATTATPTSPAEPAIKK